MGLLDDAIREHLELKRRRGSDPSEITRQEQEALGPPRRAAEPAAADDEDGPHAEPASSLPDADARPVAPARSARPEPEPAEGDDFFVDDPDDPFLPDEGDSADAESLGGSPAANLRPGAPPEGPPTADLRKEPAARAPEPAHDDPWDDETAAIVDAPQPSQPPPVRRSSAAQRLAELDEAEARRPPPAAPPVEPDRQGDEPDPYAAEDIVPADEEHDGEDLLEETPEFLEETPEHDRLWFEQRPPRDFDFDG